MPRDNDKNNDSRGRRDRPPGKSRSGVPRGPDKKFAKRGFADKDFAGKRDGEKRPYAAKRDDAKSYGKKPYSASSKPYAGKRGWCRRRAAILMTPPAVSTRTRRVRLAGIVQNHARIFARATIAAAKSAPSPHAAIARIIAATIAQPAKVVALGVSPTKNSATSGPILP